MPVLLALLAGCTLAYHTVLFTGAPSACAVVAGPFVAGLLYVSIRRSAFVQAATSWQAAAELVPAAGVGLLCASLYAFNPDDTTFFHRVASANSRWAPLALVDTRIALDEPPAMSAAHLVSAWEFQLTSLGGVFGHPLVGYQCLGSFLAGLFVYGAISRVLRMLGAGPWAALAATIVTMLFLFFDADANRRIGPWLFLGGWTGKCFLASALVLLYPTVYQAWQSGRSSDWAVVFCTAAALTGLTGSAVFILPLGFATAGAALWLVDLPHVRQKWRGLLVRSAALAAAGCYPVVIGALAVLRFGSLEDDSYWRTAESMPWLDYLQIVFASRHLTLAAGFLCLPLLGSGAARRFAVALGLYTALVLVVVANPLTMRWLWRLIPSDGYWRTFYLVQYPFVVALGVWFLADFIRRCDARNGTAWTAALVLAACLLAHLQPSHQVFALQAGWGYVARLQSPLTPKLQRSAHDSVAACALNGAHVFLAPEEWEVAAQQLHPSLRAVAARHMEHVFAQRPDDSWTVSVHVRRLAQRFVEGGAASEPEAAALAQVLAHPVDLVVVATLALPRVTPVLSNLGSWTRIHGDDRYVVFLRSDGVPETKTGQNVGQNCFLHTVERDE